MRGAAQAVRVLDPSTGYVRLADFAALEKPREIGGARTLASGALVLPVGKGGALALASYQHGTISRTNDAL